MPITPLNEHYALHTPASIYNEEDLTALELAARTTAKVNEVVNDQNALREETDQRLDTQDDKIVKAREHLDTTLNRFESTTIPGEVREQIQQTIDSGEFAEDIDHYAGDLTARVDNLLGSVKTGSTTMDAEIIDLRVDAYGTSYSNAGSAVRTPIGANHAAIREMNSRLHPVPNDVREMNRLNPRVSAGWYSHDEKSLKDVDGSAVHTDRLFVLPGEMYNVTTIAGYQAAGVVFFDLNDNVIGTALTSSTWTEFTGEWVDVPSNAVTMMVNNITNSNIKVYSTMTLYERVRTADEKNEAIQKYLMEISGKPYITGYRSISTSTAGYIHCENGDLVNEAGWTTPFISLYNFPEIFITGNCQYYVSLVTVYDKNMKRIDVLVGGDGGGELIEFDREKYTLLGILETYPTAYYVRISSYTTKPIVELATRSAVDTTVTGNVLYGKKWVACGDSFTEGDFTGYVDAAGNSGKNSDAYDGNRGMYKTYPWWIATRNGMTLVNEAKCGTTMHANGNNAFAESRYLAVPADADYITLSFGLNEAEYANLGTETSTDPSTLWGAYNTVLEHLITQNPYVKIGIIIPDAWMNVDMRNTLVTIAKYWGVPYLDLKGDPSVSLMMGGRYDAVGGVNATVKRLRENAFQVSALNTHPNLRAHEYRATVIENFLRSL